MRRLLIWTACLGLVLATGIAPSAQARTNISVGLNFGDRYDGPQPYWRGAPAVAVIPSTQIYYVRDYDYDVYRYGRFWYYNTDSRWYRSRSYRGPWIYVGYRSVPAQFSSIPTRYRHHWRTFRDDRYYQTSNRRDMRNRNNRGNYGRDRNYDNNNNRDGRWQDQNNNSRNRDMRDRDTNNDGRVDWRDR